MATADAGAFGGPPSWLSTGLATGVALLFSSPRGTGRFGGRGDGAWHAKQGRGPSIWPGFYWKGCPSGTLHSTRSPASGGGKLGTGGRWRTFLIFFPGGGPLGLGGRCRPKTTRLGVAQEMSLIRRPVGRSTHPFLPQSQGHLPMKLKAPTLVPHPLLPHRDATPGNQAQEA